MTEPDRLTEIDEAMRAHVHPEWKPLSESAKNAIRASVATAAEPTEAQLVRLSRILRNAWATL